MLWSMLVLVSENAQWTSFVPEIEVWGWMICHCWNLLGSLLLIKSTDNLHTSNRGKKLGTSGVMNFVHGVSYCWLQLTAHEYLCLTDQLFMRQTESRNFNFWPNWDLNPGPPTWETSALQLSHSDWCVFIRIDAVINFHEPFKVGHFFVSKSPHTTNQGSAIPWPIPWYEIIKNIPNKCKK